MDKLNVVDVTQNEYDEIKKEIEESNDLTVLEDVNLSALIESFEYNGFILEELILRSKNMYGDVIDFYKVTDNNGSVFYSAAYGAR